MTSVYNIMRNVWLSSIVVHSSSNLRLTLYILHIALLNAYAILDNSLQFHAMTSRAKIVDGSDDCWEQSTSKHNEIM